MSPQGQSPSPRRLGRGGEQTREAPGRVSPWVGHVRDGLLLRDGLLHGRGGGLGGPGEGAAAVGWGCFWGDRTA